MSMRRVPAGACADEASEEASEPAPSAESVARNCRRLRPVRSLITYLEQGTARMAASGARQPQHIADRIIRDRLAVGSRAMPTLDVFTHFMPPRFLQKFQQHAPDQG